MWSHDQSLVSLVFIREKLPYVQLYKYFTRKRFARVGLGSNLIRTDARYALEILWHCEKGVKIIQRKN